MNPMPPMPQQPPPPPPQYEIRWSVVLPMGAILLFAWLAGRMESSYGRWTDFLGKVGLHGADADGETRLCLLGLVLIAVVWITRIARRSR